MTNRVKVAFRVKDKGGKLAGQTIEREAPEFDWSAFKNLPGAEAFVRKAYFAAVKRIAREVAEGASQTTEAHLASMEAVIIRSLKYTQDELMEWFETRNWDLHTFKDKDKALKNIREWLGDLAVSDTSLSKDLRTKFAEIVATVADKPKDFVADYIFSKLTRPENETTFDI